MSDRIPDVDAGEAGASARREHERRKANRERRTREKHPVLGGVILALKDDPSHERVWARGAGGEEMVAQALAKKCPSVTVLHDRGIPGSRANIDHIAVAATGVWVIDTKRYKGKVQVASPLFGKAKLMVNGRDQTKLVDGLAKQVALVTAAMDDVELDVPVHGCFCFVEGELPLFGTPTINDLLVLGRNGLAKRLNSNGPLTPDGARYVAQHLAARFPAA